jgi:hypothetical protein
MKKPEPWPCARRRGPLRPAPWSGTLAEVRHAVAEEALEEFLDLRRHILAAAETIEAVTVAPLVRLTSLIALTRNARLV